MLEKFGLKTYCYSSGHRNKVVASYVLKIKSCLTLLCINLQHRCCCICHNRPGHISHLFIIVARFCSKNIRWQLNVSWGIWRVHTCMNYCDESNKMITGYSGLVMLMIYLRLPVYGEWNTIKLGKLVLPCLQLKLSMLHKLMKHRNSLGWENYSKISTMNKLGQLLLMKTTKQPYQSKIKRIDLKSWESDWQH